MTSTNHTILHVSSSARRTGSSTRTLSKQLINALETQLKDARVVERDAAAGLPFVDEDWVNANFTPEEDRSAQQQQKLALSDSLVQELKQADTLVIGMPIYNFGIPATLKAWVDMIARARLTFRYTESGPEGLLTGKRAFLVVASGGTAVGSEVDFATGYMRQALGFVGITDVTIIDGSEAAKGADAATARAEAQIAALRQPGSRAA